MNHTHAPPTQGPTNARYGVLGFVCSLSLITYLDRICIMRAKADIQKPDQLGFSDTEMGWVFAAFSLGYMLFEVPGGWMGDRWGPRRVLTRIVLWWSVFTALTGLVFQWDVGGMSMAFLTMLAIRFLFGAGEAGAYPNLTRITGDWFPVGERGFVQGGIWFSARIGGAIAPLVLGRLSVALGSWRRAFFVLGVLGLVWVVLYWRWFRDRPREHPGVNSSELDLIEGGVRHDHSGHTWPRLADLAPGLLTILALCSASFWVCFGWYFYPTWQPKYLKEVHDFEPTGIASEILTGLPFLCGAIGALGGGLISDRLVGILGPRWGRSLVGCVGFIGAGVCVMMTGFVTSATAAVTLLCLAFLINDIAIPAIWAVCADVGGRFAGSLAGLMNMVGAIGAILCPLLIPYADEWLKSVSDDPAMRWRFVFAGLASAWFIAAASWVFIDASKRLGGVKGQQKSQGQEGVNNPQPTSEQVQSKPEGVLSRTDGVV